ncbi:MAG: ribosomal protein S18-alanine N-acetyltransferase [Xanthomonadales bacterium]|nr:ribosomal protein S18-alanine N-acetyltransferase [Gammaproteobacteria bacterium]MBT8064176.1 ribosomal protein S18-alanine N-acetyltransferase [Gammaproteobacteria bacterium]NNK32982.1 ribosomal protein S18-alanine N-acetyltransferase [Xanthomonadales bacterium]NNK37253.1 ribosomal protein S18-alanine N-acetyltransferase [Xanthomonadales bacterium]
MVAEPASFHPVLRRLNGDDLDRVMEIELSAYPYPWTRGIFSDCLRVGYDCWGLQLDSELSGYCIQTHAVGECHLLNLCVAPDCHRRGLGSILLHHSMRLARQQGCASMYLEVRPSNPAGLGLYRKNGFFVVGERRGYYHSDDGREDAIVMRKDLAESGG